MNPMLSIFGRLATLMALGGAFLAGPVFAQVSESVDRSQLESWRLQTGDTIRYCRYRDVPNGVLDEEIGLEIADRLFLNATFTELGANYAIGGEYAAEDLFVTLTNTCDVMLGMGLAANAYPQEFTVTRPYVGFPYVLVVADDAFTRISDIPADLRLGAPVGSYGLRETLRYIATRPQDQRWQILPYGSTDLMVTRLVDGTIGGMVIYGPSYVEFLEENPDVEGLTVLTLEPELTARLDVGGVLLTRNSFLRDLIGEAIAAMVADGTIAELVEDSGFGAIPYQPGGYVN